MSAAAIEIPDRFDFASASEQIYQQWIAAGCFDAEVDHSKKPYTIVIPPPNVTGALHLGHALNNTLQDIQIRMHRMQGYATLWMPGTDHAGIATQAVVERRLRETENLTRHDLGRERLVERIWAWKDQYEARILGQLRRMGCSCDWRRTRFTLDDRCAAAVRRTFFDLFREGLIYRGKRLVNWDTYLQTAVSDDEVFHEAVKGHFWHIRYPVVAPKKNEPKFVTIATTRPETMLGDTAVAVHPDPSGQFNALEQQLREKIAAAGDKDRPALEAQLESLRARRESHLTSLQQLADMAADGRQLELPLTGRVIPLVADEWAKPEMGSGAVKITPAHDANDYEVGLRRSLPMINILRPDGTLNEAAGRFEGLTIAKARRQVVDELEAAGLLAEVEDREIDLAHSDRSKTPIEPYLADQWFVRMDRLAQTAIDAVADGRVEIFPPRYAKGYTDWLSEKRDWPVGRQLWWGHQIPIWSKTCDDVGEATALHARLSPLAQKHADRMAIDVEDGRTLHVSLADDEAEIVAAVEKLGLVRQEDVLDTWFSSALWPHSTLGWPEKTDELEFFYPTSTLITSRDIITLWVARMVLMGLHNCGEVPFREVFIHPKILDGYGETMSKSKGNGVDPSDVIDKFGADALRFGLCWLATDTQDVRMPVQFECPHCGGLINQTRENRVLPRIECDKCQQAFSTQWAEKPADKDLPKAAVVSERFESGRNFVNKLWNAARFAMLNLGDYQPRAIDRANLATEDKWLLSRLASVTREVTESFSGYRYADAARSVYDFAWNDLCSNYLEICKPRLAGGAEPGAVRDVLVAAIDQVLRLLHPIMPFVTETIWRQLAVVAPVRPLADVDDLRQVAPESYLVQAEWPSIRESDIDPAIESQFAVFAAVLSGIREIRSRQNVVPRQSIRYSLAVNESTGEILRPMLPFIASMAAAEAVDISPAAEAFGIGATVSLDCGTLHVDLSSVIDKEAEISRNEKLLAGVIKQITGKRAKLSNEAFTAKAPAAVVEKERQSLDELVEQQRLLESNLDRLRAL